jgi:hypothetical protein
METSTSAAIPRAPLARVPSPSSLVTLSTVVGRCGLPSMRLESCQQVVFPNGQYLRRRGKRARLPVLAEDGPTVRVLLRSTLAVRVRRVHEHVSLDFVRDCPRAALTSGWNESPAFCVTQPGRGCVKRHAGVPYEYEGSLSDKGRRISRQVPK